MVVQSDNFLTFETPRPEKKPRYRLRRRTIFESGKYLSVHLDPTLVARLGLLPRKDYVIQELISNKIVLTFVRPKEGAE